MQNNPAIDFISKGKRGMIQSINPWDNGGYFNGMIFKFISVVSLKSIIKE